MAKEVPKKNQAQQRPSNSPQQRSASSPPGRAIERHRPQEAIETYKVPEYLKPRGGAVMGGEEVSQRDIVQPRLAICQSNSPHRKQSSDKWIEGLEEGEYFNTLGVRYGESVLVVPVFFFTSNILFIDYEEGGGILCQAQDGKNGFGDPGGECMRCPLGPILGWKDEKGKRQPPDCTEFKNYACIVIPRDGMPTTEDVVVFSMKTTGIAQSKQWTSKLLTAKMHYWARIWELTTVEKSNDKDQSWFSPVVKLYDGPRVPASIADPKVPSFFVNEQMFEIGKESYGAIKDLRAQGKLKVDVEGIETPPGEREPGADEDEVHQAEHVEERPAGTAGRRSGGKSPF